MLSTTEKVLCAALYPLRKLQFSQLESWAVSLRLTLAGARQIAIARDVAIEPHVVLDGRSMTAEVGIHIGAGTQILRYVVIKARGGFVSLGARCTVQEFCKLTGRGGIRIGNDVRIASHTVIVASQHRFDRRDVPIGEQGSSGEGIVIEDDVWLGTGVRILDGVTVGRGCVVGAGAVVTNSLAPYSIAAGVPARTIGERP